MEIEDIQEIIAKDEHRCLELKKTTGELQDGMHSMGTGDRHLSQAS